jgi:L-asparaginase
MGIALVNLGGTIALSYDTAGRPVTLSGRELVGDVEHELVEVDPVQSNALSWRHLLALRAHVVSLVDRGVKGVVVITGTGTAEDVATFLDIASPPGVRIALLVSFLDATSGGRAPGVAAALSWLGAEPSDGLRLFVDGDPFDYPFEKHFGCGAWAFGVTSPRDGVPEWRLPVAASLAEVMPVVAVAPVGIGAWDWVGQLLRAVEPDGVVLEAYGAGDVPPEVAEHVGAYLARAGRVVVTSLARPGLVEPTYPGIPGTSHGLLAAGCHGGGNLTARQARMRLAVALASGIPDAVRRAFASFSPHAA